MVDVVTPLERALLDLTLGGATGQELYSARAPRVNVCRPVRFRPLESKASVVGALHNLSVGGAFIRAPLLSSPGELLALGFFLPHHGHHEPLCTMGKVVWVASQQGGFGLKFIDPPQAMVRTIEAVVRDRVGRPWEHVRLVKQST